MWDDLKKGYCSEIAWRVNKHDFNQILVKSWNAFRWIHEISSAVIFSTMQTLKPTLDKDGEDGAGEKTFFFNFMFFCFVPKPYDSP